MTKKLVGLVASVALLGSGMALADDKNKDRGQQTQQQGQMGGGAVGGSGQQGQMGGQQGQMQGQKQITGTVVKSTSNMVHLRTDNGIIPVKVNKDTQFQDPNVKRARDLKEGQQIRASFDIQGTDNVAKSITLETGMGGAGDLLDPDQGINQDAGGSGLGDQDIGGDVGGDVGGAGDVGDTGHRGDKSY